MTSGKFIVRIPKPLHLALKLEATRRGCSQNDLCVSRLALPSAVEALPSHIAKPVHFLAELAGARLAGIVLFGSWARGDNTDASDIDILVILEAGTKISRDLYRDWEAWDSADAQIEPHFVALPTLEERVSGLWAEVSLDGIIVFDRDLTVHRYLQHVRHLIAAGKLTAKRAHGQNYWVHTGVA